MDDYFELGHELYALIDSAKLDSCFTDHMITRTCEPMRGAWARVLADLDRNESAQREADVEIHVSIEALEASDDHRTVNEILGLGE